MECVSARRPLVVEMGEPLEFLVRQEPEVQQRPRKRRVDFACSELHQRRKGQCHLLQLLLEGGVAGRPPPAEHGGLVASLILHPGLLDSYLGCRSDCVLLV